MFTNADRLRPGDLVKLRNDDYDVFAPDDIFKTILQHVGGKVCIIIATQSDSNDGQRKHWDCSYCITILIDGLVGKIQHWCIGDVIVRG